MTTDVITQNENVLMKQVIEEARVCARTAKFMIAHVDQPYEVCLSVQL
jgi:hypothetical protein